MKIKIAILGATGSIGSNLLKIIEKNNHKFEIVLLTAHRNYNKLLKLSQKFNVKNLIITDLENFELLKKKTKNLKINTYNNFNQLDKIFKKKKIDYLMSSIIGINGLLPTIKSIKYTKKIAIANKESIICAWDFINKELKKNNTEFIPVDSEHFSLWCGLKNIKKNLIDKIFLTASGGPLYKLSLNKFNKISVKKALNHPNWKMGNKISIDSATMINKVYEVIEAKNIFNISYKKINIIIHPKSYVHAIIKFKNGIIKIIAHDTTMQIPIFNTLFYNTDNYINSKKIDIKKLNNLNLDSVNLKRYPITKVIKKFNEKNSLFETVLVSTNDTLVELFIQKKIKFNDIHKYLFKILFNKKFLKYKKIYPKNVKEIIKLNQYVRLKVLEKVYKSKNA